MFEKSTQTPFELIKINHLTYFELNYFRIGIGEKRTFCLHIAIQGGNHTDQFLAG